MTFSEDISQTSICVQALGSRVNCGTGYDLEVSIRFIFQGHTKCVAWAKVRWSEHH